MAGQLTLEATSRTTQTKDDQQRPRYLPRNKGQIPYDLARLHRGTIWLTLAGHPLSFVDCTIFFWKRHSPQSPLSSSTRPSRTVSNLTAL